MPSADTGQDAYSSWVGLIYVFNLIVGTGALTLPAAFSKAGWLLSLILLVILALVGFITVTFIIETIACANATVQWTRIQSHKIDGESEAIVDSDSDDNDDESTEQTAIIQGTNYSRYYTLNDKIELGQMAALFFNKWGRMFFYVSLCVYLYGDLAIYAAAIGKSMSDLVCANSTGENFDGDCWENSRLRKIDFYRVFVGLFALLVGPFTYFNLQKTKYFQMVTSTMRWCAFTVMITLAIVRLYEKGQEGHPKMFEFNGVPALLGASVYSFMCHHSLPGLVAPIADKQHVVRLLGLDYALICCFYILLAITGTFAFAELNDLYTLNFLPCTGDNDSVFMQIILYFLSLFPVFTLSTSFPIISITLQNNLKALFLDVNTIDRYGFLLRRLTFPTVAVVPPILIALATHNLHSLVKFTGAYAGACIQYFIPALLVWAARNNCKINLGNGSKNKYSSVFKGNLWIILVICWATACVILVTVNFTS